MTTTILVIGNGGREHAICLALQSDPAQKICVIASPGNPGIAKMGIACEPGTTVAEWVALAKKQKVDLVIPGPEQPLVEGLADALSAEGIPCCGPKQAAAQLESSKSFTRDLGKKVGAPMPAYAVVRTQDELQAALKDLNASDATDTIPVVKADGLAGGKGVFLPDSVANVAQQTQALFEGVLGDAGRVVVLEERMQGIEASLFFACTHNQNGIAARALPHAQDHKRLYDNDMGPNTGGMGAVSPNPIITPELQEQICQSMVLPVLEALNDAGTPFCGFLFVGVMLTGEGPKLLEFNVRLGDPEAQVILPRLPAGAFAKLCQDLAHNRPIDENLHIDPRPTCGIVLASEGYPFAPRKGDAIEIDAAFGCSKRWLVHASTQIDTDTTQLQTAGGRVACVVAQGANAHEAREVAYAGLEHIRFKGMQTRQDIGTTSSSDA